MEDEMIVQLYFQRSEDAVVQTEQKYGKLLWHVAESILRDYRDVEEIVADTYVRLWNSIPPQRPHKLGAFAVKLARNRALDMLRRKTADKRDNRKDVLFSELESCLPASDSVSMRLDEQELILLINTYLLTVDRTSRMLFVRRYFAMEEIAELAEVFGMTTQAVSGRLFRVRRGLKEHLQKEGVTV